MYTLHDVHVPGGGCGRTLTGQILGLFVCADQEALRGSLHLPEKGRISVVNSNTLNLDPDPELSTNGHNIGALVSLPGTMRYSVETSQPTWYHVWC